MLDSRYTTFDRQDHGVKPADPQPYRVYEGVGTYAIRPLTPLLVRFVVAITRSYASHYTSIRIIKVRYASYVTRSLHRAQLQYLGTGSVISLNL